MISAAKAASELIHDPTHHTRITVLDALAKGRDISTRHRKFEDRLQCQGRCCLHSGRGTQAGTEI